MKRARTRARGSSSRSGGERLQKILSSAGLTSRRDAERWILEGRVTVDGRVVRELGTRADPERERIAVDGRPIPTRRGSKTYALYKPRGVVTTTRDPHARRAAVDLVRVRERLFPVGRLDLASEGLLLLTNDGALAHVLTHPSFEVPRTYRVSVQGSVDRSALARLRAGVEVGGRPAVPRKIDVLDREGERTVLEVTLCEGRKRQIREMMRAVGHPVRRLVRTSFGPIRLGRLGPGEWRPLRATELRALERMLGGTQLPTASRRRSTASRRSAKS
jgi:pseudouridine synthase